MTLLPKQRKRPLGFASAGTNCFIAGSGLFTYDDIAPGLKELTALVPDGQKE